MPGYCASDCTCLDPNCALEKEVELNYVASMTAAYGKANKLLAVEDCNTDATMKKNFCILPPGVRGSNAYFNDGRINLNNYHQLQAFLFIHTKQFDSNDLLNAGLSLYTMNRGTDAITSAQASCATAAAVKAKNPHSNAGTNFIDSFNNDTAADSNDDNASATAASGATIADSQKDLWLKVEADIPAGSSPKDYCLDVLNNVSSQQLKGYFVCFQIPIEGTNVSYDILTNRRAKSKSANDAAFAHMTRGKRSPRRGKRAVSYACSKDLGTLCHVLDSCPLSSDIFL
jgi:hypothetical protein